MRSTPILLAVFLFAHAPVVQAVGPVVVAAREEGKVAGGLVQRADYIVRTLVLGDREGNSSQGYQAISAARRKVIEALSDSKQVSIVEAPSIAGPAGLSGSLDKQVRSEARIQILLPIIDNDQDFFRGAMEIADLVDSLGIQGGIESSLSGANLAMDSPEKYRGRIIDRIYGQASAARERMKGVGRIVIEGLEGPVRVRQVDSLRVELYLDYRLVFEVR
jgi:hypothetical protein